MPGPLHGQTSGLFQGEVPCVTACRIYILPTHLVCVELLYGLRQFRLCVCVSPTKLPSLVHLTLFSPRKSLVLIALFCVARCFFRRHVSHENGTNYATGSSVVLRLLTLKAILTS